MGILDWFKPKKAPPVQREQDIEILIPDGLKLYPFQAKGVQWLSRRKRAILSDDMGTGKTIQMIALINSINARKVLVVCPATLKLNWESELKKWLVKDQSIQVLSSKSAMNGADITIVNYDILDRFDLSKHWDIVVCDEAHFLKNPKTKRYKSLFKNLNTKRLYFVTGTPLVNRPVELWPLLSQIDESWSNYGYFTTRYCGATLRRVTYNRVIRDVSGASNLDELHKRLKPIMLRRLRKDVLSELPDKTRQIISLPANGASKIILEEQTLTKRKLTHLESLEAKIEAATSDLEFAKAVNKLESYLSSQFVSMATTRRELGIAKVSAAIDHIYDILDSGEKIVIFAHHRDVINMLAAQLPGALIITGSTPVPERQRIIDEFQRNPQAKVFLGNIKAAGTGITLTAAHHVVFIELDWTPGNMSQAEDRVVRIGQKNPVLIQYLVFDGSLDARIAKILAWKQQIFNRAIEGK